MNTSCLQMFENIIANVGDIPTCFIPADIPADIPTGFTPKNYVQIKDNCVVVQNLVFFGFVSEEEVEYLKRFEEGVFTRRGSKNLEKTLQSLVVSGIQKMGATLVISNVPKTGLVRDTDTTEDIDCVHIYDTLEYFSTPEKVFKMSNNTYVAFYKNYQDAIEIAKTLDGTFISGTPMTVYTVEPFFGEPKKPTDYRSNDHSNDHSNEYSIKSSKEIVKHMTTILQNMLLFFFYWFIAILSFVVFMTKHYFHSGLDQSMLDQSYSNETL